jgi:hypothetical protein
MPDHLDSVVAVEDALSKLLAPIGLQIETAIWKRDLKNSVMTLSLKATGSTDEQLTLFE